MSEYLMDRFDEFTGYDEEIGDLTLLVFCFKVRFTPVYEVLMLYIDFVNCDRCDSLMIPNPLYDYRLWQGIGLLYDCEDCACDCVKDVDFYYTDDCPECGNSCCDKCARGCTCRV